MIILFGIHEGKCINNILVRFDNRFWVRTDHDTIRSIPDPVTVCILSMVIAPLIAHVVLFPDAKMGIHELEW